MASRFKGKSNRSWSTRPTAATQGLTAIEEMVAAGAHSGQAAIMSQQKAVEINTDLTRIIHGCTELANKLGVSVASSSPSTISTPTTRSSSLNAQ